MVQVSPQETTIAYDRNCTQGYDGQAVGHQANPTTPDTNRHSFLVQGLPQSAISVQNNLPSTLLEPDGWNLPTRSGYPTGSCVSDPGCIATVTGYTSTFAPFSGFEDLFSDGPSTLHPVYGPVSHSSYEVLSDDPTTAVANGHMDDVEQEDGSYSNQYFGGK